MDRKGEKDHSTYVLFSKTMHYRKPYLLIYLISIGYLFVFSYHITSNLNFKLLESIISRIETVSPIYTAFHIPPVTGTADVLTSRVSVDYTAR